VKVHVSLFLTCPAIYYDAASTFYSNNTFAITQSPRKRFDYPRFSLIEVAVGLLKALGLQSRWVRKILIDLTSLRNDSFYKSPNPHSDERLCPESPETFEVTPLLRFMWNQRLDIDVSYK
jgi:hypothetical protein